MFSEKESTFRYLYLRVCVVFADLANALTRAVADCHQCAKPLALRQKKPASHRIRNALHYTARFVVGLSQNSFRKTETHNDMNEH